MGSTDKEEIVKKLTAAAVLGCLAGWTAPAPAAELTPYGFVRFDAVLDDSKLNHHQYPNWVKPEPPGAEDKGNLTMYPRLTRVGARFTPVEVGQDSEIGGVIEADFQNGGSESRQILRLRKAYFNLRKGDWHFLAGQTWDLISPLFPAANNDGMMWNTGNLGDRHPQARLTFKPGTGLSAAVALGQTGAVDKKDLDGNGVLDGWEAMVPFVQARVGIEQARFKAGAWAHWATEKTGTPVAGDSSFTSTVVGVDFSVSPAGRLAIEGEGWTGSNLSDIRGGIGQGVNRETGEEIASSGGWVHLLVKPGEGWKLYAGAMMDTPDEEAVPEGGRTSNQAFYVVNRYRPWKSFQAAVEYINWTTEHKGLHDGTANRVDIHFTWNF